VPQQATQGRVGADRALPGLILGQPFQLGEQRGPLVVQSAVQRGQLGFDIRRIDAREGRNEGHIRESAPVGSLPKPNITFESRGGASLGYG